MNTKKILIVDDNELNIKVAKRALQDFNFDIDEALEGQVCIDKISSGSKYDLILMDIMMPNMSGETTLKKLKEIDGFNTPVVALTADAMAGAQERYIEEGFIDYIAKPFSRDQIKEKLEVIFNNKKEIKEQPREDIHDVISVKDENIEDLTYDILGNAFVGNLFDISNDIDNTSQNLVAYLELEDIKKLSKKHEKNYRFNLVH